MTYVKITTASFSAAATVNIDNCFSADYDQYLVLRKYSGTGAGANVSLRFRAAGSTDTSANYDIQQFYSSGATTSGYQDLGGTSWPNHLGQTETADTGFTLVKISNPFTTVVTTGWAFNAFGLSSNITQYRIVGQLDTVTSYDGLTFFASSGTITGSVTIYGLRES